MEETAASQVLGFHDVSPLVENGLELAVHVACEDEADAHELPLRELLKRVELDLGDFIDHNNGSRLWRAALFGVLAEVVLQSLASYKHRGAVSQSRDDLLVVAADFVELS